METKGADITINGGLVYSTGSNYGIRGSSIEINGGNVISCKNNDTDNWQSFATSVKNFKGDIVRFASVQLDNIDADRKLTVTCGSRTYEVQSDKQARVNVILFQGDGDDIKIKSESGNEYTIDYSTLDTPETVTDRPFRYPVLTITPDSGQKAQYGDPFVPSYKVYDAGNTQVENTDSILSGAPEYKKKYDFWDTPPFDVIITYGNLKVIDGEHCITFTQNVEADILKRKIQVSAKDLEVYEGQYSRLNLPFVLKLEEGSLLPGDTLENAFDLIVGQINGENYFSAGTYTDLDITFESDYYEVSMKGQKPALKVLENECLLRPDEILTFGTDSDGNTLQWVVAHVTDQKSFLYSKNVYDNDTYSSAVIKRNQSGDYINEKFPSLSNYKFLKEIDILDLTWLEAISQDGGKAAAKAEDIYGNPKKYWLVNYRYHNSLYIDENGKMKETSDETDTAGLRIILAADIRSHTVPVISLSDKITSSAEYGDIKAGTQIAQVKDSANISGHELTSLKLLNKTRDADSFTLKDNGTIVADKMLTPGSYTLYVQSEDTTGYKTERSVTFKVKQRQLEIVPQSGISVYTGDSVPRIPYTYDSSQLFPGDTLKGDLGVKGDLSVAGQYPITLGTLSAGDNYHLVLAGGVNLTVMDRIRPGTGSGTGDTPEGGTSEREVSENTPGKKRVRKRVPRKSTSYDKVVPVGDTRKSDILFLMIVLCGAGAIACRKSQKTVFNK